MIQMPEFCSLCGAPLHYGKWSNEEHCPVCSVETCIRCTTFAFCSPYFPALSPPSQGIVKLVYRPNLIIPLCLLIGNNHNYGNKDSDLGTDWKPYQALLVVIQRDIFYSFRHYRSYLQAITRQENLVPRLHSIILIRLNVIF